MKRLDLTGRRYGNLTTVRALEPHVTKGGFRVSVWLCRCDCGNEKAVAYNALLRVLSCGDSECPFHQALKTKTRTGAAGFSQVWRQYKHRASKLGILFTLTRDEMAGLMALDCAYCGSPPANDSLTPSFRGQFKYNGLDRVIPSRGYVINNVRPCCWTCNIMKGQLSVNEFLAHLERVLRHCGMRESRAA